MDKLLLSNTGIMCLKLSKYVYRSNYGWISHVFWICLNIYEYVQLWINIVHSVENMPEYGWERISLNIPGLLICLKCLNKTKRGWISLEYGWVCLKYSVKDTVKLLQKLDSIYKRAYSELRQNCIKRPRLSFCENI